jgi:hypothetical protein
MSGLYHFKSSLWHSHEAPACRWKFPLYQTLAFVHSVPSLGQTKPRSHYELTLHGVAVTNPFVFDESGRHTTVPHKFGELTQSTCVQ